MSTPANILSRGETLKQLRLKHAESVERTQALLREQKRTQQQICALLREKPRTVPEIAQAIGLPTEKVLWFLAAMKKYGLVIEAGMCGDFPLYQNAEEQ
jgi:predicted transcriptional regulator